MMSDLPTLASADLDPALAGFLAQALSLIHI